MLRPEKKAAAKAKTAKPAAKSPSYWSRIAGALGLESAAEAEPAPEAPIEQPIVEPESTESIAESILPPDHFAPRRSEEPRPRDREEFAPREGGRRPSRRDERQPRGEERPPRAAPAKNVNREVKIAHRVAKSARRGVKNAAVVKSATCHRHRLCPQRSTKCSAAKRLTSTYSVWAWADR